MSMPTPDAADLPEVTPCMEAKAAAVADAAFDGDDKLAPDFYDFVTPEYVVKRLDHMDTQLHLLSNGVNQIGAQTTWIAGKIQFAFDTFAAMQAEMSKVGPLGIIGMITGNKKGTPISGKDNDNG